MRNKKLAKLLQCLIEIHALILKHLDPNLAILTYLYNTNDLSLGILDGHTKDSVVLEAGALVHRGVESRVHVSVRYIYSLECFKHE